ncbi:MAG TPA: chloride channel protein, partial [Bacteroidia bacterium]|nr:chloride channel protein [Bacteroidia bacterium]
ASILVGLSAGLAAVILKLFVSAIKHYLVEGYLLRIDFKYIYLLLPLIGIGFTVVIVSYFFRNQIYKGASYILYAIAKRSGFLPF